MRFLYLAIAPIVLLAQTFTLVVNTKSGEQIRLATEDIVNMVFEEDPVPDPVQLDTPKVTATVAGNKVNVSWTAVENATGYQYTIDNGTPAKTANCKLTTKAEVGTHTITVVALGDGDLYLDSEAGSASYSYSDVNIVISEENVTSTTATVKFTPSADTFSYYCALLPQNQAENDSDVAMYFAKGGDVKTGTFTLTAKDLTPSTNYVAVAYVEEDGVVFRKSIRTSADNSFKPGDTGTLFAYGCDRNSGWYDVDKIYNRAGEIWPSATDALMCWACSTAGCLQWWLDEYEKEFGHKPETRYEIPATSEYYSAPMMEIMVSTFPDDAYDAYKAYQWFFIPIAKPENMTTGNHPTFKEDSPYRFGGFLERDQAFVNAYSKKYTAWELFPLSDPADKIEATFNGLIYDLLESGVVEITVNNGIHSVICWGVDYVVKADGTRSVTKLYIAENGGTANTLNGLQTVDVSYIKGDVSLSSGCNNLTSMTVLRSPRVVKLK